MNEWRLFPIIQKQRREAILPEQMQPALSQGQIILAAGLEMSLVSQWELCSDREGCKTLLYSQGCDVLPRNDFYTAWAFLFRGEREEGFLMSLIAFRFFKVLRFSHLKGRHDHTGAPVVQPQNGRLSRRILWTLAEGFLQPHHALGLGVIPPSGACAE